MEKLDEFQAMLMIDHNQLDVELCRQPSIFMEVGSNAVYAGAVVETLKGDLKEAEAKIGLILRAEFEDKGKKVTEAIITASVATQKHIVKHREKLGDALLTYQEWQCLRDAFMQRGFILRDLAQLYIAGYFSSDSVKQVEPGEEYDAIRQRHAEGRKGKPAARRPKRRETSA